jgi:hypothetical protein
LKANNPYFSDVTVNELVLNALPVDGFDPNIVQCNVELSDSKVVDAVAGGNKFVPAALAPVAAEPGTEDSIQFVTGAQIGMASKNTHYQNAAEAIESLMEPLQPHSANQKSATKYVRAYACACLSACLHACARLLCVFECVLIDGLLGCVFLVPSFAA